MSDADALPTVDGPALGPPHQRLSGPSHMPLPEQPPGAPRIGGYHLLHKLGEGGMGVVWKAVQLTTRRHVALKLLGSAAFGSEHARLRFQREVELAARLEHPCIARVYDSGQTPGSYSETAPGSPGSPGYAYYAMELIEGTDLETHVRANGLSPRDILALMHQVCLGVQHAHQRGVIHRDLKPSNIMVAVATENARSHSHGPTPTLRESASKASGTPTPKIVDFGLAKTTLLDDAAITLTHVGQVAGTPAYMSPEQAAGLGDRIDTRTDVYALGVILYRLLTGRYPHDTTVDFVTLLRNIRELEVIRPRRASEDASRLIDRELETLLLKALAKDADRRYDNAGALAMDLDNYLHDRPLSARPASVSYVLRKTLVRHRAAVAAAAGMVLLLSGSAGGGVYWLAQRPADLRLDSNPRGAQVKVDGVLKEGCGLTPCQVKLGPGRHTVELILPGHYQAHVRQVDVSWGQIAGDAFEPIQLAPTSRTYIIQTTPAAAHGQVRDALTGQVVETFNTPHTLTLPRGKYRLHLALPGEPLPAEGELIEVFGAALPLTIQRELKPHGV